MILKKIKSQNIKNLHDFNSLCPICLTRRLVNIFPNDIPIPLKLIFKKFKFHNIKPKKNQDQYIAVISMNGDHVEKLTRGESKNFARWEKIIHPGMLEKYKNYLQKNKPQLTNQFTEIMNEKRVITPQVHQFLSESLTDFSIHTVPYVIKKHGGQFLYLGGHDVVAIFPVKNALRAVLEIRNFYRTSFALLNTKGEVKACTEKLTLQKGERLLTHPGKAVTMSAAVVFAHVDENAGELLRFTRQTLDNEAKDNVGRDGLAVVLKKQDSTTSMLSQHWEDQEGESFVDFLMGEARDLMGKETTNQQDDFHQIAGFISKFIN